jgi:hypothetical protein
LTEIVPVPGSRGYNENRAILLNKLKNYVVTIELILAGDENLTPNQNIEIFSAVYSFIRSTRQRYKQKIIVHNADNYTNKFYNMIYLDVNNKVSIKKNKMK